MRAVRYYGREDVRVDDIPEPVCGSGQVKVCQATKPPGTTKCFNFSPSKDQTSICRNLWQWLVIVYLPILRPFI